MRCLTERRQLFAIMTLNKNSLLCLLIFSMASAKLFAQADTSVHFIKMYPFPVSYFATNSAGELYLLSPDNQLKKFDVNGDSVGVFNDVKKYGRLTYVKAQNPWKTILFYEGFETIVLLDKYLKNLGSIPLREKNIFAAKAVTTSYDNFIWVFDGREFKIKKIDDNGNLLMASADLRQTMTDVPNPAEIIDKDGLLYLYDPDKGVFIFDYYGAFKTMLPYKNWKYLYISGKNITGIGEQKIYKYTPPLPVLNETMLPQALQQADLISISNRKLYLLKGSTLSVYAID